MHNVRVNMLIIKDKKKILLMHRIKNGTEYFVIPGGSVEPGESLEEAAIREAKEETGLNVILGKKLWKYHNDKDDRDNFYFLVTKYSGELKLGGPEIDRVSKVNQYYLEWHDFSKLNDLNFVPEAIKTKVIKTFLEKTDNTI